jgi:hypothetical protein
MGMQSPDFSVDEQLTRSEGANQAKEVHEGAGRALFEEFSKLLKDGDSAAERNNKFTDAELKERSDKAVKLILRNDDFGYGPKKEQLKELFAEAASKGKGAVDQLTSAVNEKLKVHGLKLEGNYTTSTKTVDEAVYPKNGEAIFIYPQLYQYKYAGGEFSLRNTSTGRVEDSVKVQGRQLSKTYLGNRREDVIPWHLELQ